MTINLHIGMPHLLPNLIHEINKSVIVNPGEMATVVSKGEWRSHYRPMLSQSRRQILQIASIPKSQGPHIRPDSDNISISQHTFLGKGVDLFSASYSVGDYVEKVETLVDFFESQNINIHVLIKDQYGYLKALDEESLDFILQSGQICPPSWSDFIHAIRSSAPNAKVVVWDCEEDNKVAFAFAKWMLKLANERIMYEVYEIVRRYIRKYSETRRKKELLIPPTVVDSLDLQYSVDCDAIYKMKGVSFVQAEQIPKAFHVDL